MLRKTLIALALIGMLWGCATSEDNIEIFARPPEIVDYYAAKAIRPGDTWKIYLWAQDQGGDMKSIVSVLYQPGYGYHSREITRIKQKDRARFAGYLSLNTPRDSMLIGTRLNLKVLIRDQQGNGSEIVDIPLTFDMVPREKIPAQWQVAAKHRLGGLPIDIVSPSRFDRSGY